MSFIPFDPDSHAKTGVLLHPSPPSKETRNAEKGLSRPLSNWQKWKLSELAESVYDHLRDAGELRGIQLDDWRRQVAVKACGQRISRASLGDFKHIQAAFLQERGRVDAAKRALAQAQAAPAAIAMYKLMELCRKAGTPAAYAHTLAARFYKGAELSSLTAKQLWTIFYTIQNNANAKAGIGSAANRSKNKRRAGA